MSVPPKRLLIVDDDERLAGLVSWFFRRKGLEVESCPSYAVARELLRVERVDVLISDVELNGESARMELPDLAREGILPATIVASGFLDEAAVREFQALREVRVMLRKPFDFDLLERAMVRCLQPASTPAEVWFDSPEAGNGAQDVIRGQEAGSRPGGRTAAQQPSELVQPPPAEAGAGGWIEIRPTNSG